MTKPEAEKSNPEELDKLTIEVVKVIKSVLEMMSEYCDDLQFVIARNLIICQRLIKSHDKDAELLRDQYYKFEGTGKSKKQILWLYEKTTGRRGETMKPYKNAKGDYCVFDPDKKYPSNITTFGVPPEKFAVFVENFNKMAGEEIKDITWYKADSELASELLHNGKLKANHAVVLSGTIIEKAVLEDPV